MYICMCGEVSSLRAVACNNSQSATHANYATRRNQILHVCAGVRLCVCVCECGVCTPAGLNSYAEFRHTDATHVRRLDYALLLHAF